MAGLVKHKDYKVPIVNICMNDTRGEIIVIDGLPIQLPKQPKKKDILFYDKPKKEQHWVREEIPKELSKIKSMDEWYEAPSEFREKWSPYIEEQFRRRREGLWFYNNGKATYITGYHWMFLQWSRIDIGYPYFFNSQRKIEVHWKACVEDPRSFGQVFTKNRRSGFTNEASSSLVDDATIVKDKLLGIQSKTASDARENVFTKKVVQIYRSYPFFFKPIQDGTTNPKAELAFREPSKRITKKNKTSNRGEALNTIINWKSTTNGAYDGEKLYRLFLDEDAKWEKPADITEAWRIEKTCLMVGRKIVGKARVGSTINPLDKGGKEGVKLRRDSIVTERDDNGQTKSGLYHLYISALEALEGFIDVYGMPVIETPKEPVMGIDGEWIEIGSREYMKNKRRALEHDAKELNEYIRQFSWTFEEACRDSTEGSIFNIGKIYQQIEYNDTMIVDPVVKGNFHWANGVRDSYVEFSPNPDGRFYITWRPEFEEANKSILRYGLKHPANPHIGVGGVDSYDIDKTVDTRASKGALLMYNKPELQTDKAPSNMVVLEYAARPNKATIFYEDVLMAAVYYGYPLLIENNKQRIIHYFEERGYVKYVMPRPSFLRPKNSRYVTNDLGVPSNSADVIDQHAQAIEAFIEDNVGWNSTKGEHGKMYFNRTLEDCVKFDISDRTKSDLTIALGFALLGAQRRHVVEKPKDFTDKKFFRRYKFNA